MAFIRHFGAAWIFSVWAGLANAVPVNFDFEFDNLFNSLPLDPPIVGTGQVRFDDVGNGSFSLTALTNLSMQFSIAGEIFSLGDADTPLGEVLAVVSDYEGGRRFQFSNTRGFGSGPYFGSIDFTNAGGANLTFQPPGYGDSLDLYQMTGPRVGTMGSYLAVNAVPVPGTLAVFCVALGLLVLLRRLPFSRNVGHQAAVV